MKALLTALARVRAATALQELHAALFASGRPLLCSHPCSAAPAGFSPKAAASTATGAGPQRVMAGQGPAAQLQQAVKHERGAAVAQGDAAASDQPCANDPALTAAQPEPDSPEAYAQVGDKDEARAEAEARTPTGAEHVVAPGFRGAPATERGTLYEGAKCERPS